MPNQYWKSQEYRVRDIFRKSGWVANRVPCSGSAEGFKGDVIATKGEVSAFVDHKSTRGKESITIKKKDLVDVDINAQKMAVKGNGVFDVYGIETFSFFHDRTVYAIVPLDEIISLLFPGE